MISATIFFISLGLSLLFIGIGSQYRDEDLGVYLALAGFLVMMVLGVASFSGLSYRSGDSVIESYSYTNDSIDSITAITSYSYSSDNSIISYLISLTLTVSGMAGLWSSIVFMGEKKRSDEEDLQYDQD